MNWKIAATVLVKELRETLRDRRSLVIIIVIPALLYPALFVLTQQLALFHHTRPDFKRRLRVRRHWQPGGPPSVVPPGAPPPGFDRAAEPSARSASRRVPKDGGSGAVRRP